MPTFYFDVYDGQRATYDEFGTELPGLDEAADEAAALLPEFARETLPDRQSHRFGAAVRDESDTVVYRAMLLFEGQKTADADRAHAAILLDAQRQCAQSADLRAAGKSLTEQLAKNVEGLLTTFGDLKAQVEASRKALASHRPAGIR